MCVAVPYGLTLAKSHSDLFARLPNLSSLGSAVYHFAFAFAQDFHLNACFMCRWQVLMT